MKVSISKAASMVGITRATLYRHIKKKDISVGKDAEGNPKIDVSELIRVYGDQVRVDGKKPATPSSSLSSKPPAALDTASKTVEQAVHSTQSQTSSQKKSTQKQSSKQIVQSEMEILRERIRFYETERDNWKKERQREREQLLEQVENLRKILSKSQEQQHRLTALLTDQRDTSQKSIYAANTNDQHRQARQIELIQDTMQRLENQNKRIAFELQREKNKKFFKRVFG